jgi:hypothetical protein
MTVIIVVAVCSTLSLVALVYLFVAMFIGLGKSVKKDRYYGDLQENDRRFREFDHQMEEKLNSIIDSFKDQLNSLESKSNEDYHQIFDHLKNIRKTIDSRCDKLEYKFLKSGTKLSELEERLLEK